MKIQIDLGNGKWLRRSRMLGLAIKPLLEANTQINQVLLTALQAKGVPLPPLYQSGVVYREEDPAQGYEDFALIPAIIGRGWGDCDDLAPWRCAELRCRGEQAQIRVQWKKNLRDGSKLYHIVVRRENGDIEDPSLKLGMRG